MNTASNLKLVEQPQEEIDIVLRSYDEIVTELGKRIAQDNDEYNALCDELESLQTTHELCKAELKRALDEVESLKRSAAVVISNAEKIQSVAETERAQRRVEQAELRELRLLDPKRLAKVNKELKAKNAELKESNKKLEALRKEALKQHMMMFKKQQDNGVLDSWVSPTTGQAIRVTKLQVSKENSYGGVPGTPVLEFFNPATGVTRQGTLNNEGGMSWVFDPCEMPPSEINTVAKETILAFCKRHSIKLPKGIK